MNTESNLDPTTATRRSRRRVAGVIAGVLLAGSALGVGGVALSLRHTVDKNVKHAALLPGQSGPAPTFAAGAPGDGAPATTTPTDDCAGASDPSTDKATQMPDGTIRDIAGQPFLDAQGKPFVVPPATRTMATRPVTQPVRSPAAGESVNYLILGADHTPTSGGSLGDVMAVAHISGDRTRVDLVNIQCSLWTPAPGRGLARVADAYRAGGIPLLVQAIQPLVGVPIDHVVMADFSSFQQWVDALGGVSIDGRQLDGIQAIAWMRTQPPGGAATSRGEREIRLLRTVLSATLRPEVMLDPGKFNAVLDAGTKSLTVDQGLSTADLQSLALDLRGLTAEDMHTHHIATVWVAHRTGRRPIAVPDEAKTARLRSALSSDSMPGYTDTAADPSGR